ncbi:MAG: glycoside hydrolase family 97 catalytic domain-containing protein [Bacteroidales bacterium]|nr:glycoside hydrolase family 97 catalytic domain-containing protein [Bacteroidales bacterium]
MKKILCLALAALVLLPGCNTRPLYEAQSPDGHLCFTLENVRQDDGSRQLMYHVERNARPVILPSRLGLEMDGAEYGRNLPRPEIRTRLIDEAYTLSSGKQLRTRDYCTEHTLTFRPQGKRCFQLVVRVYDDGAAFRYVFPDTDGTPHTIGSEATEFAIPAGKAWIHPYDWNSRKKPSYEQFSRNAIPVRTVAPKEQGWAFPMLFETDGGWSLVTEASLDGCYPATHIDNSGTAGAYRIRFPEADEPVIPDDPRPCSTLPWTLPWRVIATGPGLDTIFSTQIVAHLNPPCALEDTDWIRAGKATWSWWYSGGTVRDYKAQLKYVDFCREMGWDYSLIDASWERMDGEGMEGVVRHAAEQGVGIWLWYHSGAGRDSSIMSDPPARRAEMKRLQELGVRGIKVDFFDTDKQRVIALYPAILEDAAAHHLMVDFHGATLPHGWERTWPNLMSTEAIKGAEGLGRQETCDRMAEHDATVVFTRNVVGSMDYTPVTFSNKIRQGVPAIRKTSMAHQLALAVAFESGFQCFADRAEAYQALSEGPKAFLRDVPAAWDESVLLAGYPSNYAVIARRKGDVWWIGGINGKPETRELTFNLPPSCQGKTIRWFTDGADINSFAECDMTSLDGTVRLTVLGGGGFAGRLVTD